MFTTLKNKKLSAIIVVFIVLVAVGLIVMPTPVLAEYSAKLTAPEGLMKDNIKIKGAAETMNWVITSVCMLSTIIFGVNAGKKLNDEQYTAAIGPIVGSVVAGTATFLAYSIMS